MFFQVIGFFFLIDAEVDENFPELKKIISLSAGKCLTLMKMQFTEKRAFLAKRFISKAEWTHSMKRIGLPIVVGLPIAEEIYLLREVLKWFIGRKREERISNLLSRVFLNDANEWKKQNKNKTRLLHFLQRCKHVLQWQIYFAQYTNSANYNIRP